MSKLLFLKNGKNFLRSVIKQRRWLLAHDKGYIETDFAIREIHNIEHALATIKSADKMRIYLERKAAVLRYLIPATNHKSQNQLNELLSTHFN